jgi:hypothetical protein
VWSLSGLTALAVGADGRTYTGSAQSANHGPDPIEMTIFAVVDTP